MPTVTPGEPPSTQPVDLWLPPVGPDGYVPLVFDDVDVRVARYTPDEGAGAQYQELSNVRVVDLRRSIGTDPGSCRLRYVFADAGLGADPEAPNTMEAALSTAAISAKTILPGDRIVVGGYRRGDGAFKPLFDGEATSFEGTISSGEERVTILCRGIAARALDTPVGGATWRDGDHPSAVSDHRTDVEPHVNPKGRANCCPDGDGAGSTWAAAAGGGFVEHYPTFLDPDNSHTGSDAPTYWDLPKTARYLCYKHNDGVHVANPDGAELDATLVARVPIDGTPYDPLNPTTYTAESIRAPDKPLGGKDWPNDVRDLIADKGFETRWTLESDSDGTPKTTFEVIDPRAGRLRDVFLQPRNTPIDLARSNMAAGSFARDLSGVVNAWEVQGDFVEVEASFVLAAGYANVAGVTDFALYDSDSEGFAERYDDFRKFVLDESGEGHYPPGSATASSTVPDLDAVLGTPVDGQRTWSYRRRPPLGDLLSRPDGAPPTATPMKHILHVSTDYAGACPAVWDGTGNWQAVGDGYALLKDRVGIRITAKKLNDWNIDPTKPDAVSPPFGDGKVKIVERLTAGTPIYFLLTCVVRRDFRVFGVADRRENNVLPHTVRRVVDAHDRYRKQIIAKGSWYAQAASADIVVRDDIPAATAEAVALRTATENGVLGGSVTIPWLTLDYELGDRIRSIFGRGLGFRTDGGADGETPVYPIVTGIRHTFEGGQMTELELSDATIARVPYTARSARRHARPPGSRGTRG